MTIESAPREPEMPIHAANILGAHILGLTAPRDEAALNAGSEQIMFSSPRRVIGYLNPKTLEEFAEEFIFVDKEPLLRGWHLTAGRIATAHVFWLTSDSHPDQSIAALQLRGARAVGKLQDALTLRLHMQGVIDKSADNAEVVFGRVGPTGDHGGIMHLAFPNNELRDLLPHPKVGALAGVFIEAESLLAQAEFKPAIQKTRRMLPYTWM